MGPTGGGVGGYKQGLCPRESKNTGSLLLWLGLYHLGGEAVGRSSKRAVVLRHESF